MAPRLGNAADSIKAGDAWGVNMSEADLMRAIQLDCSVGDVRLFRNNVGVLQDNKGHYIRYGLAVGSSDLIGWRTVTIMPRDVGNDVAVFCAIETKSLSGLLTKPQRAFIDTVNLSGGFAGMARSVGDARRILGY